MTTPSSTRKGRISRRKFLQGTAGAAVGGIVVGGGLEYLVGPQRAGSNDASANSSGARGTIKIGAPLPITGPYSADGQEMDRGQQLAIDEINASGGVAGYTVERVLIDVKDPYEAGNMVSAMQRLVNQEKVAAIFCGFTTTTSAEYSIVGDSHIPMFHLNTLQANVDYARTHGYTNIFEICPTELWYGSGLGKLTENLESTGAWSPSSKTIALLSSTDPYSINIANEFSKELGAKGWTTSLFEKVQTPKVDWSGELSKIRSNPPGIIFMTDYLPGDLASFMKAFASAPTKSLVIQQYGPSVPQYLQLAGDAANGVIWSTVIGLLPDSIGDAFRAKYKSQFKVEPGLSQAGGQYDALRLWRSAASQAGNPQDLEAVGTALRATNFRGVSGSYSFTANWDKDKSLAATEYPDQVNDPSVGMPELFFQIQDQKQVLIAPDPYTQGKYQPQSWLS